MDYKFKDSFQAYAVKAELKRAGVNARLLVDPMSGYYQSLAEFDHLVLRISDQDAQRLTVSVETLMAKAS
jgi:hypothetical protein